MRTENNVLCSNKKDQDPTQQKEEHRYQVLKKSGPMEFSNSYDDPTRADSYATVQFPGTYYLAYRDLPKLITTYVKGKKVLDFGCGTGRSTRFLRNLGFDAVGVDIAAEMITKARALDPQGDYRLINDGDFHQFQKNTYDLVLSVFTFDNIPTMEKKVTILREIKRLLNKQGRIIALDSTPDIYTHEWASFSTKDFPENRFAKTGDKVKIIMKDVKDARPVEDILWTDEEYQHCFTKARLAVIKTHKPLANKNEPYPWVNETQIAPWVIYVMKKAGKTSH